MTDTAGIPIGVVIDGANRNDCKLTEQTILSIPVPQPAPTVEQPHGVCLDEAYDHQFVRDILANLDLTPHIRSRGEEAKDLRDDPN